MSLTHLDEDGRVRMVDVGDKTATRRMAVAEGRIDCAPETLALVIDGTAPKGAVIATAEIAGVTALLVHAISEQARRFYRSRGFIESPVKPMTLCLMLATVDLALREP